MEPRVLAEHICRTLQAAGHQAYFVGGCVRDILLGREPADYDVATDATPDRIRELFSPSSVVLEVGAKFGVMLVGEPGRSAEGSLLTVEVATFRSDLGYSDGRHPDNVVFSKAAQEDVKRRDLLQALTSGLERVWYAGTPATRQDFLESSRLVQELGCRWQ